MIDDGSSDRTAAIARDAGARVIQTPNGGVARARNLGIEAARTEWIALLDADDRWHPEKLEAQWAALQTCSDTGLVITDFAFVDVDGTRHENGVAINPGYRRTHPVAVSPGVIRLDGADAARGLIFGSFVLPSTALFRRAIARDREALFAPRGELDRSTYHTFPEDSEWCLRYCRSSGVLVVLRTLVDYQFTPTGLSAHPGRVRYGDVFLMDRIITRPECYPTGIAALARKRRPAIARSAVAIFARRLEIDAATVVARDAWRATGGPREALLLLALRVLSGAPVRKAIALLQLFWRNRFKYVVNARKG